MSGLKCSAVLEESPGFGNLLLWLDRQVLTRHCCQGETIEEIAAVLSLTPAEARRLHDSASTRLALAVLRLLIDLDIAEPTSLISDIWNSNGGQAGTNQPPAHRPANGRDALAA
jgi:hypothetical protein